MSRVLVTGGSGFVGAAAVAELVRRGHDVHVAARTPHEAPAATYHSADLLDATVPAALCERVRPSHLLHLAWYTEPRRFWNDALENMRWVEATLRLVRAFTNAGGRCVVATGTAAEAAASGGATASIYAAAKGATASVLAAAAPGLGAQVAWARLHQPYGPGERSERLLPTVARTLTTGGVFRAATSGTQLRDFIHVDDVATALATLVEAEATGSFDVGTGRGSSVRDVVTAVASRLGAEQRVAFGLDTLPSHEPEVLVADTTPLKALGWRPSIGLETGLDQLALGMPR